MNNPGKILTTREVYRNPWFSVREHDVTRPDGKPGIYAVVDTRIATGVVALTENNDVYLVGQYRFPVEAYSWEIIEGGSEPGEEPLAAAKRELKEEAGITAQHWEALGHPLHLSNCISSEESRLYLATGLTLGESSPDGTEILKIKTLPLRECLELVLSGEITDAMSVIAIMLVCRKLGVQ